MTDDPEPIDDLDEIDPDADRYLSPEEVMENFDEYAAVLEAEMEMAEQVVEEIEAGDVNPENLVEVLPTPTPLEAWQSDRWDEFDADDFVVGLP